MRRFYETSLQVNGRVLSGEIAASGWDPSKTVRLLSRECLELGTGQMAKRYSDATAAGRDSVTGGVTGSGWRIA